MWVDYFLFLKLCLLLLPKGNMKPGTNLSRRSSFFFAKLISTTTLDMYDEPFYATAQKIFMQFRWKESVALIFKWTFSSCGRSSKSKKYSKCFKNGGKRKDKVLVFILSILDAINHWCSLKSDWLPLVQFVHR